MTETLTALEVCCCGNCAAQGHQKETIRPLTAEEIAQREIGATEQTAREAEEAARAAAKASGEAKLAALGLTAEEISAL
jgi:hypothetical protein